MNEQTTGRHAYEHSRRHEGANRRYAAEGRLERAFRKKLAMVLMVMMWVCVGQFHKAFAENTGAQVKVAQVDLYDAARQRPVKITIWYPAGQGCEGADACLAENVRLDTGVLLSHGAMGAARNYNWIGYALASKGFVTVGLNHFGESWAYGTDKIDPTSVMRFWERPQDARFVLDQLQANTVGGMAILSKAVNWGNVTAIGHSSGGATVLALAGAAYDLARAKPYCQTAAAKADKSCGYMARRKGENGKAPKSMPSFKDSRVKKLILLDPALGHMAVGESLRAIDMLVLMVGSRNNDFLPFETHAGFYAGALPNSTKVFLTGDEGHFVYMDRCDHSHEAMGVALCKDKAGVNRDAVHGRLYPAIFRHLFTPAPRR